MSEVSASTVSQVDPLALDVLFNEARTHNVWQEKEVEDKILEDLYSLMKMAPTSMNISPARIVFVKSNFQQVCVPVRDSESCFLR